ncbi:hypothetical protein [Corynebacterium liangguodongii]|uniref:Uncharacterized protein n=1 Tax=Corynebacterium liangguodongii TaxID=2079535 RepID=A0A2S0WE93_9CORY|nr:hypothetical protein [Corynebacterium liangguodongii]AWB84088.1 hypothetical protein C3E79_06020 [Corynebacterium liangguodongii]PWC00099.1 hypothetical protein DF219_02660 [Corynebacterium liangguodongii]
MGLFGKKRDQQQPVLGPVTVERLLAVCREAGLQVEAMTTGDYLVEYNGLQIVVAHAQDHVALGTYVLAGEGENYSSAFSVANDWVIEHNNGNNGPVAFITEQAFEGAMRVVVHCEYRILDGLELTDAQFRDEVLYGLDGVARGIYRFVEFRDSRM